LGVFGVYWVTLFCKYSFYNHMVESV